MSARRILAPHVSVAIAALCALLLCMVQAHAATPAGKPRAAASAAVDAPPAPAIGEHGMVLFGERNLLVANLPSYAAPHDYQVVTQVWIQDPRIAKQVMAELDAGIQITLQTERIDLLGLDPAAAKPLPGFIARLYRGHYAYGGTLWLESVYFETMQTMVFRKLSAKAPRQKRMEYFAIPDGGSTYLIHRIGGSPSFVQIAIAGSGRRGGGGARRSKGGGKSGGGMYSLTTPGEDRASAALGPADWTDSFLRSKGWSALEMVYFDPAGLR